jgi:hypothetical protein
LRELKRLLGINAGRELEIFVGPRTFYINSVIDNVGEESVRVEDKNSGDFLISNEWPEIADFINIRVKCIFAFEEPHLYELVLSLAILAYTNQTYPNGTARVGLLEALIRLAEEEPLIRERLKFP